MHPAKPSHSTIRLRQTETNPLSVLLEQHQHDLNQLRLKLNTCATKGRKENNAFEQIASLKADIEILSFDNLSILAALREQKESRSDFLERVARQFSEFHKLRRGVKEYVQGMESSPGAKQKLVTDSVQFLGAFQSESSRLWSRFSTTMNAFFF